MRPQVSPDSTPLTERTLLPAADPLRGLRWSGAPPAWVILLAATPLLAALYLLLPTSGPARTIAYPAFGLIAMVAVIVGIHRARPARVRSWRLIALALALLSLGDIMYSVLAVGEGDVPYPSLADVGYLAGYVALVIGVLGLVRGRFVGGDMAPVVDAAILSAAAGSLLWHVIIQPSLVGAVDILATSVSLSYPTLDFILLVLGVRVLLSGAARPPYLHLLVAGLALYLMADVIYAVHVLDGTYAEGNPVDAGWIVGVLFLAAAALHPSVADPVALVEPSLGNLSRWRVIQLGIAALVAPVILVTYGFQAGDDTVTGLAVQVIVLFFLVLARLVTTVSELGASLRHRRRLQSELLHQANHDPLTRLPNRTLFAARLESALATEPDSTAVIFLDIDDFKAINDTLGHPAGDELLRILGGRLNGGLRAGDLAARISGDEFAILVEGCASAQTPVVVAERILTLLRAPVLLGVRQLVTHASAGVAMGHAGATATDLMRNADIAMYRAKATGKDRAEAYEAVMHGGVVQDYELRSELAEAIESGAFVLHYQAIFGLETGTISGAEALVRWNHVDRGLLGPSEFIPQAEASGHIHGLGRWILRDACATAAGWPRRMDGEWPVITVNLAPSQLVHPGLADDVAQILAETGLAPHRLILEVTESALLDMELACAALLRLRGLGVRLALDDFGTGYSALSYLAELPFDIIKIDRSFVARTDDGGRGGALLEGVVALCQGMKLIIVAEGIERPAQLARLRQLGCRFGQGYLLARPAAATEFLTLLIDSGAQKPRLDVPTRRVAVAV